MLEETSEVEKLNGAYNTFLEPLSQEWINGRY